MCGRYYIEDRKASGGRKDIRPSEPAEVLCGDGKRLISEQMIWGFPRPEGKGLLINARAESALEKKSFRDSVLHRRCAIPAKGFYEWNPYKEKFTYERQDSLRLFLAGCYALFECRKRFVILTTGANASVSPVHSRMPLILEPGEVRQWVLEDAETEKFLRKIPVQLRAETEYEQLRLF